jgi:hypothetical protein
MILGAAVAQMAKDAMEAEVGAERRVYARRAKGGRARVAAALRRIAAWLEPAPASVRRAGT